MKNKVSAALVVVSETRTSMGPLDPNELVAGIPGVDHRALGGVPSNEIAVCVSR